MKTNKFQYRFYAVYNISIKYFYSMRVSDFVFLSIFDSECVSDGITSTLAASVR